jgi:signal transduction histidine kinase
MLLALMSSQAYFAFNQVSQLTATTREVAEKAMTRVEQVSRINTALAELRGAELGYVLRLSAEERSYYRMGIEGLWQDVQGSIERYRRIINDPRRLADYEAFLTHIDEYREIDNRILRLRDEVGAEQAQQYFTASQSDFNAMQYHIDRLRAEEFMVSRQLSQIVSQAASRSRYLFALGTFTVAVVEVGLVFYIFRSLSGGLGTLLEGTRRVTQGDLSLTLPVSSRDEFGELAQAFNTMVGSLRASQDENLRLTEESLRMQEEHIQSLRDSLAKVARAQEDERKRVALELHDQTGQSLTVLQLGLARLERDSTTEHTKKQAASLRTLSVETMEAVRNLALDLRPSALDELGLGPALQDYVRDISRRVGIPVEMEAIPVEVRLPPEMEVALFRVVQEGLTNIAKHSQASRSWVSLKIKEREVEVVVKDNGVGFEVDKVIHYPQRSLGLFGIRERVELMGGTFTVESQPGAGTRLHIVVPLPQTREEPLPRR